MTFQCSHQECRWDDLTHAFDRSRENNDLYFFIGSIVAKNKSYDQNEVSNFAYFWPILPIKTKFPYFHTYFIGFVAFLPKFPQIFPKFCLWDTKKISYRGQNILAILFISHTRSAVETIWHTHSIVLRNGGLLFFYRIYRCKNQKLWPKWNWKFCLFLAYKAHENPNFHIFIHIL